MKSAQAVAIVGVGGIFPSAPTLELFWKTISAGRSAAKVPPAGRWLLDTESIFDPTVGAPDKVYSTRACFIDEDPATLLPDDPALDRSALLGLDPLFQLVVAAGWRAFAAGKNATLDRERVGVILGNLALPSETSSAYARETLGRTLAEQVLGRDVPLTGPATDPRNVCVAGLPAGLLARTLGLGGSTFTLDAACASSLYAIKLAVDELVAERADAMLCGGLSRPDSLYTQMGFAQLHALSPSGTCSPFDRKGDGLVVGEGCGIFLLKRLKDALDSGDRILAVIRGIGLSNDLGGSLLAPATEGQLRAMRAAYQQAGWKPSDVDLIECHATGTPVGDAVEFASLRTLWGESGWKRGQCVIGSVKSNIGHLLTAAGSAALTKVLLALQEGTLPPTANFSVPAKGVELEGSPFTVLDQGQPWTPRKKGVPRRAAVSAFGFGGINAHLLIEEWLEQKPEKVRAISAPFKRKAPAVAIVGLGASFGPCTDLAAVTQRVLGSRSEMAPQAPQHWWGAQQSRWFQAAALDRIPFAGYFVPEVSATPGEFRIPPKELEEMLPRQLLMLKVAEAALRDAGLKNEDLLFTGVYIGTGLDLNATNFSVRWSMQLEARRWAEELDLQLNAGELAEWISELRSACGPALSANRTMGALGSIVASRVAKEFRIGGPSFTLSSEENSGLRALEVAVRALQQGSITRAVVGAVDFAGDLRTVLARHASRRYAASGLLRPFDPASDGTLPGEGAAAVILKRLDEAQRDGDRIYAVIEGLGTATAGQPGAMVPAEHAVHLAVSRTLLEADCAPKQVAYLESHGSGDPVEDSVEAAALGTIFGAAASENPCWVGSAKADLGHAGAASGLLSLVKTSLMLQHRLLPPLRGSRLVGPRWSQAQRPCLFPAGPQYWLRNRSEGPRRALVSGLGSDGSASAVLLAECETTPLPAQSPLRNDSEALFIVEGSDAGELQKGIAALRSSASSEIPLAQLAARRLAEQPLDGARALAITLIAADRSELVTLCDLAERHLGTTPQLRLDGSSSVAVPTALREKIFYNPKPLARQGEIAFVFPGSSNHFATMGRELSAQWPAIYQAQDAASDYLLRQYLPQHFWGESLNDDVHDHHNALVIGQVALGTAVSDLVRSFAIKPRTVSGYSLGESAGLFSLQAWRDRDGMASRLRASTLFTEQLAGTCTAAREVWNLPTKEEVDWLLGLVAVPQAQVRAAIKGMKRVYLLIVNTPQECVIGGQRQAVEALVAKLGCHLLPLRGVTTVHCEVAQPCAKPYRELHLFPTTPPEGVRFYSGALGRSFEVTREKVADNILAQALETVDYPKVIEQAYADGARIFLEMGPGNSCSRMIGRILGDRPHLARAACYPGADPLGILLRLLASVIAERVAVDLTPLYPVRPPVALTPAKGPAIRTTIGGEGFKVPALPRKKAVVSISPISPIGPISPIDPMGPIGPIGPMEKPAPAPVAAATTSDPLLSQLETTLARQAESHAAYLQFSATVGQALSESLALQMQLLQQLGASGAEIPPLPDPLPPGERETSPVTFSASQSVPPAFDRSMCMEFAIGSIAKMLGPEFAEVDSYPTRVRLPDEPLMLCDRIMTVEGEPRSMSSGRVVTEHDVTERRWYLDAGRIPTCVAVEAGQADLFLSGYLGIDFITKGQAVYRLLDAEVTFHRSLPTVGETIRYDIHIDHFFRQDQTYLFRFHFEGTVNGEPLLSMKKGCAGFFSAAELAAGKGIVHTKLDLMAKPGIRPADWRELAPLAGIERYDDAQIAALRQGDLAACFGPAFANLPLVKPYTLPEGLLKLVDRVVELNPTGGRFGLGTIRAEADIHPDDWFLTCHFCDDHVMPGTLMYECCLHTLRIYLLRMGWIGESGTVAYEPVPGVASQLKCRGQVIETTKVVTYEVAIKELGYRPEPYAIVDALMYADGKPIVGIGDMTVRLSGLNREKVEGLWHRQGAGAIHELPLQTLRHNDQPVGAIHELPPPAISPQTRRPALYDYARILAYSVGNPSEAFGERYKVFDAERKIARLPGPPFQFLDRIVAVDGEPWVLKAGATVEAEYDVPADAWYFKAGRQPEMPFAVLLETGLQPCGWLAAYLGSALTSPIDLSFRNLDGNAVQHRPVTPQSGTLTTKVKITRVASSGGMIIQGYDFEISDAQGPVYTGDTVFGFFSKEALANQVGVRDAKLYAPSAEEAARGERFAYPTEAPFPEKQLRMVDTVELFVADGGPQALGFIRGSKRVDPSEWFFKAHFYQDPVCPGSLGLESFLQLLKLAAARRWQAGPDAVLETVAVGERHKWNYRGQIIPTNKQVTIEAVVTSVDDAEKLLKGDGYLLVDGKVIYQMFDFSVRVR